MGSSNYNFGAGGFKLGGRVEVMTTKQRGIIISEIIHISGCNSFLVLIPKVIKSGRALIRNCDYLILRELDDNEAVFGKEDNLTEETIFSPKGTDVNAEWIKSSVLDGKEPIPEVDEAVGIEEIIIQPGTEVWHKAYCKTMLVVYISRDFNSKELIYGLIYMDDDKEVSVTAKSYTLIPLERQLDINTSEDRKKGSIFDETYLPIYEKLSFDDFEI